MNKIVKVINKHNNTPRGLLDAVEGIGRKYVMNQHWDHVFDYEEGTTDNWDYDGSFVAMTWSGKDYWYELTFNEKSFTIFIIFDLVVVSPFVILDLLDSIGLI